MAQTDTLSVRFNLVENAWYDMPCPIVFFAFNSLFERCGQNAETVRSLLLDRQRVKILEIGNIKINKYGDLVFRIFLDGLIVNLCLNNKNKNIIVKDVLDTSLMTDLKRRFIESQRKTISVEKYGIIFSREPADGGAHDVSPINVAEQMKIDYSLDFSDNMPKNHYEDFYRYIKTDAKKAIDTKQEEKFKATYFSKKYLDKVIQYAYAEHALEQQEIDSAYTLTYLSRKSIKVEGDKSRKYIYEFICPDFDTELYPQNSEVSVVLNSGDKNHTKSVAGTIITIENLEENNEIYKKIVVTFREHFNESELPESGGDIKKLANDCQKRVREGVVEQFKTGDVTAKYMLNAFNNPDRIITQELDDKLDINAILDEIAQREAPYPPNEKQRAAIASGILSKDLTLVLGPPGTGKTTVIVEWAIHFMRQGKRVLISSKNNKAVDNAFERIAKKQKKLPELKDSLIARLGNVDKVQHNVREYMVENQHDQIQKRILSSSSSFALQIKDDLTHIANAEKLLKSRQNKLDQFFSTKRKLVNEFYTPLSAHTSKLIELEAAIKAEQEKIENKIKELEKTYDEIAECRIYLEEEEKRNFIIRLFHFRETKFIKSRMDILTRKANETKITDTSVPLIKEYNKRVNKIALIFKEEKFKNLKEQYKVLEQELKSELKITIVPKFYPEIVYTFSEDKEKLISFQEQLKELKNNLSYLKDVLGDWYNTVADKTNSVLSDILIDSVAVVGATCIGINTNRQFLNVDFDVAIIDEAGQIQIHDAIVPMSRAAKTLMLGDHKQIPPHVDQEMLMFCEGSDTTLLEQSFFQYIFEKGNLPDTNKIVLDTQFRMPKPVADILSNQFYDNKYYTFKNKQTDNRSGEVKKVFKKQLVLIDTSDSKDRFEKYEGHEKYNPYEAKIVSKVLKKLGIGSDNALFARDDIGVIAPLKRQKQTIQSTVKREIPALSNKDVESMIASLDSFQGQERELIIYSSTRCNKRGEIGFLNELRRLNVALSRCQEQLVIIGDFEFLTTCRDNPNEEKQSYDDGFYFDDMFEDEEETDILENYDDEEYEDYDDMEYDDIENQDDGEEFPMMFGAENEDNKAEADKFSSPELDNSRKRFSEFMLYLLNEVKNGKGEYIKSKELGE